MRDVGVVEHVPAHPAEEPVGQRRRAAVGVLHDQQRGAEPAVVDAGQERVDAAAVLGPGRDDVAGRLVVPVVVHAARLVVLHPQQRREGLHEPRRCTRRGG